MQSITLVGAHIKVYLNGQLYPPVQSISYTIDNGATEIWGVDALYPQEIIPVKSSVSGSIAGLKLKNSGGFQATGATALANNILSHPYISIRIQDRSTGEDILLIPKAKISTEAWNFGTKQSAKFNISFKGIVPLQPLDRV
jgi:hypothetical protein